MRRRTTMSAFLRAISYVHCLSHFLTKADQLSSTQLHVQEMDTCVSAKYTLLDEICTLVTDTEG